MDGPAFVKILREEAHWMTLGSYDDIDLKIANAFEALASRIEGAS